MVLSLNMARTRFAVWMSATRLDVRLPHVSISMPPVAADSIQPPPEYPRQFPTPSSPYALEFEEGEPTWEDAEWQ